MKNELLHKFIILHLIIKTKHFVEKQTKDQKMSRYLLQIYFSQWWSLFCEIKYVKSRQKGAHFNNIMNSALFYDIFCLYTCIIFQFLLHSLTLRSFLTKFNFILSLTKFYLAFSTAHNYQIISYIYWFLFCFF